jgi:hypothetical protein
MTDIREQSAKAAEKHVRGDGRPLTWTEMTVYIDGYLAGYEAAKAEAYQCPGDTHTCPAFVRGDCKGTEAEWNDESCEQRKP